MFQRFTDRARRVVVLAQEEARGLNHGYIGTEHLLLGLIAENDGVAALVLRQARVTLERAREVLVSSVGTGPEPPSGHIPFTSGAKKALELSLRESNVLGHNYIGTEHLLLGVLRDESPDEYGLAVLHGCDVTPEELRSAVMQKLKEYEDAEIAAKTAAWEAAPKPPEMVTNVERPTPIDVARAVLSGTEVHPGEVVVLAHAYRDEYDRNQNRAHRTREVIELFEALQGHTSIDGEWLYGWRSTIHGIIEGDAEKP